MTFDDFKDTCKTIFSPYKGMALINIHDVTNLIEQLAGIAKIYAFPHRPQLMTLGTVSYLVMVDYTGRYGSFPLD